MEEMAEYIQKQKIRLLNKYSCESIQEVIIKLESILKEKALKVQSK